MLRVRTATRAAMAALMLLAGSAGFAQWWNADYANRIPVTITNPAGGTQPTANLTAEVPLAIPAGVRADYADIRALFWNGTAWTELDRQVLVDSVADSTVNARVVFRLAAPLADGATSTGQYFIYYGNPSPAGAAPTDVYKIYDYVVDFADDTPGNLATDWQTFTSNEQVRVINWRGRKVGLLEYNQSGGFNHPTAFVKDGAMPKFLNLESYSHMAPYGGGQLEQAPIVRVPQSATNSYPDPNFAYGGGYAYATDGFGTWGNDVMVSYVNPTVSRGPGIISPLIARRGHVNDYENIILRVEGRGLLSGKAWKDYEPQPTWRFAAVDRTAMNPADTPKRNGVEDPIYDQPGGVGVAAYAGAVAMDFIALRELLTTVTAGTAEAAPASTSRIAGVVTGRNNAPVANASVTVTGGSTNITVTTNAAGEYKVSVPAGAYSVSVSAPAYATKAVASVSPSPAGQTNVALDFNGGVINGTARKKFFGTQVANALAVLIDSAGMRVAETRTDSQGKFTLIAPAAGTYRVAALEVPNKIVSDTIFGDSTVVTVAAGASLDVPLALNFPANKNFEVPRPDYAGPEGWDGYMWSPTRQMPWPEWRYTKEQNHTPDGHYSIAFANQVGTLSWNISSGLSAGEFSAISGVFNRTYSVWVYFTQAGQVVRFRLSVRDAADAEIPPTGSQTLTSTADMVGKWNEITFAVPANPNIAKIEPFLEATGGGGTVYFDDLNVVETPIAVATGKVVDETGAGVAGAYVGTLIESGVFGENTLLNGPFTQTADDGTFNLYVAQTGEIPVAAWTVPARTDNVLPDYGYVVGSATANATPTPGTPVTVTIRRATNVANGATVSATDTNGSRNITGNLANAVDNDLGTRWDEYSGVTDPKAAQTINFDLGSAQQVDQVELWWEYAVPYHYTVYVGPELTNLTPIYETPGDMSSGAQGLRADLTPFADGPVHVIKVPNDQKANVRYIQVIPDFFESGLGNYSLTELRALNLAAPLPLTPADVQAILRMVGGLAPATQADVTRYDQDASNSLTIVDAVALLKKIQ